MHHRSMSSPTAVLCAVFLLCSSLLLAPRATAVDRPTKPAPSEIAELKREVEALRAENQRLRRMLVEETERGVKAMAEKRAKVGAEAPAMGKAGTPAPEPVSASHRLSNTGKRHNARCRYFSSAGRACGKDEGVACKVCGG